jgi:hypothetical protein
LGDPQIRVGSWRCSQCGQEHQAVSARDGNYGSVSVCPGHPPVLKGALLSEREGKFLEYCKGLERDLENGKRLRPSKGLATGAAVSPGDFVDFAAARFSEIDRKGSEEQLGFIESESKEFPRIAERYRAYLDEAVRQYKGFVV